MVTNLKPVYTNSLQGKFAACLKQALSDWFGVTDAQCPVLYTGQPIPQTAMRCVTYSKLNSHRVGFQGRMLLTDDNDEHGFDDIANWVDEISFQVNVRCKETITDTVNTPVAKDIADGIMTWFNSAQGGDFMRGQKIYPVRASETRNITNTDESDLFQAIASFEVAVQVGQAKTMREIDYQVPKLDEIIAVPDQLKHTGIIGV